MTGSPLPPDSATQTCAGIEAHSSWQQALDDLATSQTDVTTLNARITTLEATISEHVRTENDLRDKLIAVMDEKSGLQSESNRRSSQGELSLPSSASSALVDSAD